MPSKHRRQALLMSLLVAAPAFAQVTQTTGAIRGVVSSKKGDFIENATVTVTSLETGQVRTVKTDMLGYYSVPFLAIGGYEITVTASGYKTAKDSRVRISLGTTNSMHFDMDVAQMEATVEVVGEATQVDPERVSAATLLSTEALTNLPVAGRTWEKFAFLAPQVTESTQRGDIAIGGQRGVNTTINVDGGNYNSSFFGGTLGKEAGGTPFTLSSEAIREFQVITDGASAEFGRMGGGYLNAITKSGSNDFSGSAFYYTRPQSMVSRSHANGGEISDFTNKQFGATVGGPIIKDKLFFFVALDFQRDDRPNPVIFGTTPANPITLDPTQAGDRALIARSGYYVTHNNLDALFARVDWFLNPNHNLQVRLNQSKFTGDNNTGWNRTYEVTSLEEGKTLSLVGQWTWTINTNWMNEASLNHVRENLPRTARSTTPQVAIGSGSNTIAVYGQNRFNRSFETKNTQFKDVVTYINGPWQIRAGADLTITEVFETFTPTGAGLYSFSNLANFRAGNWSSYQQFFSLRPGVSMAEAGTLDTREKEMSAFVQADWHITSTFKLGAGLRWDRQEHPGFGTANFTDSPLTFQFPANRLDGKIPTDSSISPRLSFAWTPDFDKGHTVFRGSAGLYVSRTPSVFIYQVYTSNGYRAGAVTVSSADQLTVANTYTNFLRGSGFSYDNPYRLPDDAFTTLQAAKVPFAPLVQTFDPNFKNPRTRRYNLGAERGFDMGLSLALNATYAHTTNLERITDLNLKAVGTNAQGRVIYDNTLATPTNWTGTSGKMRRPNAAYDGMQVYKSDAEGTYTAYSLTAKYQKEGVPVQAQISYTYAKERDNDSNERSFTGFNTADPNNLNGDYSWSANDRRNVITGFVSLQDKWVTGINLGFNIRYQSGLGYTPTYSNDLNADGVRGNDRPLGMERNALREPGRTQVDLKLSRDFKFSKKVGLQISADVFNLFNKVVRFTKVTGYGGNDAATTVNTGTVAISNERQVQLGARLSF